VGESYSDDDNKLVLDDPYCSVAPDTTGLAQDRVYADSYFTPLTYNYFSHFFETYIKNKK